MKTINPPEENRPTFQDFRGLSRTAARGGHNKAHHPHWKCAYICVQYRRGLRCPVCANTVFFNRREHSAFRPLWTPHPTSVNLSNEVQTQCTDHTTTGRLFCITPTNLNICKHYETSLHRINSSWHCPTAIWNWHHTTAESRVRSLTFFDNMKALIFFCKNVSITTIPLITPLKNVQEATRHILNRWLYFNSILMEPELPGGFILWIF